MKCRQTRPESRSLTTSARARQADRQRGRHSWALVAAPPLYVRKPLDNIFSFTSRAPTLIPYTYALSIRPAIVFEGQCLGKWHLQLTDTSCGPPASHSRVCRPLASAESKANQSGRRRHSHTGLRTLRSPSKIRKQSFLRIRQRGIVATNHNGGGCGKVSEREPRTRSGPRGRQIQYVTQFQDSQSFGNSLIIWYRAPDP